MNKKPRFLEKGEHYRNTITKCSNKHNIKPTINLHFIICTTSNLKQHSKDKSNPQKILFCFSTH